MRNLAELVRSLMELMRVNGWAQFAQVGLSAYILTNLRLLAIFSNTARFFTMWMKQKYAQVPNQRQHWCFVSRKSFVHVVDQLVRLFRRSLCESCAEDFAQVGLSAYKNS